MLQQDLQKFDSPYLWSIGKEFAYEYFTIEKVQFGKMTLKERLLVVSILAFIGLRIQGIPVAEFQMDGKFSEETYLNYTGNLGMKNLTNFSSCMRFNLNYYRSARSFMLSYSSDLHDNAFVVLLDIDEENLLIPSKLKVCKYAHENNECIQLEIGRKIHQEWHHFCFVLQSNLKDYSPSEMETNMKLYYDGAIAKEAKVIMKKEAFLTLYNEGALVLGQENDQILTGGFFDESQAFSGKLTQVEMWNTELKPSQIQGMLLCPARSVLWFYFLVTFW